MEDLKKSFLIHGSHIVGFSDKNFSTAPLGTVLSFAGQTAPHGYLLCDGASYKVADYPHLYAVIGNTYGGDSTNFNVPDFRETVLVGVGENTTDTIASHDVYGLGEFKDDQFQGHWHKLGSSDGMVTVSLGAGDKGGSINSAAPEVNVKRYPVNTALDAITDGTNGEPRTSTTTHGKQKGVTYIIKAFHTNEGVDSGVSDDVIEYVEGELATKLDKGYITGVTDANNAIGENGVNIFVMSASSANMPLPRTGVIRSYTTIENKYIRINQEYSTIDNSPQNGGTYKRYGASDDGGATFTWSNWSSVGSIDVDISKVFSNGALNISTLCGTYGNGRYVIVGQGTAGNGSATIDIWTLASKAISYIVNVTYSNKTSNTFIGLTYENPTVNFETNYLSACNHIAKVCTLA